MKITFPVFQTSLDQVRATIEGQLKGLKDIKPFDPALEQDEHPEEREEEWNRQREELRRLLERFATEIRAALGK